MTAAVREKINKQQLQVEPRSPSRGHRAWWRDLLEAVVWLVVIVLGTEGIFALAGIGEGEYMKGDPVCGVGIMPNKNITWRKEGFSRQRTNSFGMMNDECPLAKPPGVKRIAIVGDSYVESLQVDRAQNMCSLLERRLNGGTAGGAKWQVLNFGVSAANLGQMYLRMKTSAFKFHPDIVVVPVRVDSVFQVIPMANGGFLCARPSFFLGDKGQLIEDHTIMNEWQRTREAKRMRATAWLREHSRIWGFVSSMVEELAGWWAQVQKGKSWGAEVTNKQTAFGGTPSGGAGTLPAPTGAAGTLPAPTGAAGTLPASRGLSPAATIGPCPGAAGTLPASRGLSSAATIGPCPGAAGTPAGTASHPPANIGSRDPAKYENDMRATRYYWPIAEALLKAMNDACRAQGCTFVIARLPVCQDWRNDLESQLLHETAARYHIPIIDTDPRFEAEKRTGPPIWYNTHFTPRGHIIFSDELFKYLSAAKLVN